MKTTADLSSIKTTFEFSESEYLNSFLDDDWRIIGTRPKCEKTFYTVGHNHEKHPLPAVYAQYARAIINVAKNRI
jgi:hypothetical protein